MLSGLSYIFRLILHSLIKVYKWLELQLLFRLTPHLQRQSRGLCKRMGVVFHFTEDGDIYTPEKWTPKDEEKALAKCSSRYSSVVHLQIKNKREFLARGTNKWCCGFGESYMDDQWYCPQGDEEITQFIKRFLENGLLSVFLNPWNRLLNYTELCLVNLQTRGGSKELIDKHYDLGNDLYETFLDPWMQYTCGYWAKSDNLNDAQLDKLDLIAKKLDLKPGMRVLDIGCGWGMLCKYLAERYQVECVGVTISDEQLQYAKEKCKGLNIDIRMQDYRDVNEKFDRIVVVGMLEHVGFQNYELFFKIVSQNLKDDGIFLLHTIGLNHDDMPRSEPWIHNYIFPNSNLPFPFDIAKVTQGKFIIEDWHNFGYPDYVKTLHAWRENFRNNWSKISDKYGERFFRMWIFYLAFCAGIFESRRAQLWQIVLTKDGLQTGYRAAR